MAIQNFELSHMSDPQLLESTRAAVAEERRLTACVLVHLEEVERRGLHLDRYASMFQFCLQDLRYSESEANARISAMRLAREMPEITQAVEQGRLSLTNLVKAHAYFKQEKKTGTPVSAQAKKELLQELEGKSKRECEVILARLSPQALPAERERVLTPTHMEISFTADQELMADLERIRAFWGHHGKLSYAELIQRMAKQILKRIDPAREPQRRRAQPQEKAPFPTETKNSPFPDQVELNEEVGLSPTPPLSIPPADFVTPRSRAIPRANRRKVWQQDDSQCSYVDPKTGRRCRSRFALEVDHVLAYAHGGTHDPSNLRLLCRAHHARHTERIFRKRE
jgi:hypothetical protein